MKEHCYCCRFLYRSLIHLGNFIAPFLLLFMRLFWGLLFFYAGITKFEDISKTVEFFTQAGIPWPTFNAYFVGIVESVCGLAFAVGFATRFFAIPLIVTMCVAIWTVNHSLLLNILNEPSAFISGTPPLTYLIATLVVFCFGPGIFSLDYFFERFCCKDKCN